MRYAWHKTRPTLRLVAQLVRSFVPLVPVLGTISDVAEVVGVLRERNARRSR